SLWGMSDRPRSGFSRGFCPARPLTATSTPCPWGPRMGTQLGSSLYGSVSTPTTVGDDAFPPVARKLGACSRIPIGRRARDPGVSVVEVLDEGDGSRWTDSTGDVDHYDGNRPTCQMVISN